MSAYYLTEPQWQIIYAIFKTLPHLYLGNEAKARRFVEAVFWLARGGTAWRLLPSEYGHWNSVYKRFARWCERGVWEALFQHVSADPDLEWLLMDSTTIRAQTCAAGALKKTVGKPPKDWAAAAVGSVANSIS